MHTLKYNDLGLNLSAIKAYSVCFSMLVAELSLLLVQVSQIFCSPMFRGQS